MTDQKISGFTLVELLVVISIIAILSAILFPVFAKVREKARQTTCVSNLRNLALSISAYTQDNDESYPCGTQGTGNTQIGVGWAAQIYPYVTSKKMYQCLSDTAPVSDSTNTASNVSFGLNLNAAPKQLSDLVNASRTVLLFETTGTVTDVTAPWDGTSGDSSSPAADGNTAGFNGTGRYATGVMSGASSTVGAANGNFSAIAGRHSNGANIAFADAHVKWVNPRFVSTGANNTTGGADCATFTSGAVNGKAAAVGCPITNLSATFSVY